MELEKKLGKTDMLINAGDIGIVSIFDGPKGGECDTGENLDALSPEIDVAANKWVIVAKKQDWEIVAAEC